MTRYVIFEAIIATAAYTISRCYACIIQPVGNIPKYIYIIDSKKN